MLDGVPEVPSMMEGGEPQSTTAVEHQRLKFAILNLYFRSSSHIVREIDMILPVHSGVVSQIPLAKQDTVADPDRMYPLLQR